MAEGYFSILLSKVASLSRSGLKLSRYHWWCLIRLRLSLGLCYLASGMPSSTDGLRWRGLQESRLEHGEWPRSFSFFHSSSLFWEFFTPFNLFSEPLSLIFLELIFWAAVSIAEALAIAAVFEWKPARVARSSL